jgi:DNA replication protein DnaC
MNLIELNRSLVQLRLSGMAAVLETRMLQAQAEAMAPIDLISILVSDELARRSERLLERRHKQAQFRDEDKRIDNFDFQFNPKINRGLVFDLATSVRPAAARATSPRPSATRSSSRATACSTARRTNCWKN